MRIACVWINFSAENSGEKYVKNLRQIKQEKETRNDNHKLQEEVVAILDKIMDWKSIITGQHKTVLINLKLK